MDVNYKDIKYLFLDFDGVLTDNDVYVDQNGAESVRCTRADGIGLSKLKKLGIGILVLSTETNPVVSARCKKLGIGCEQAIKDKEAFLKQYLKENGIDASSAAFIGNDENDLTALGVVGFPIAVNDAYPKVKEAANYTTKRDGGCGAVREVCDLIAEANQK